MAHGGGPTGAQGMLSPSPDAASDASTPDQALYLQQCEAQCCSPLATVMQQLGTRAAHLDLSNTPLDVAQLQCLLPVLQQTQHLQALELCNAGITNALCTTLAEGLARATSVQHLALKDNPISFIAGRALLHLARTNPYIATIDVQRCHLNATLYEKLQQALATNRSAAPSTRGFQDLEQSVLDLNSPTVLGSSAYFAHLEMEGRLNPGDTASSGTDGTNSPRFGNGSASDSDDLCQVLSDDVPSPSPVPPLPPFHPSATTTPGDRAPAAAPVPAEDSHAAPAADFPRAWAPDAPPPPAPVRHGSVPVARASSPPPVAAAVGPLPPAPVGPAAVAGLPESPARPNRRASAPSSGKPTVIKPLATPKGHRSPAPAPGSARQPPPPTPTSGRRGSCHNAGLGTQRPSLPSAGAAPAPAVGRPRKKKRDKARPVTLLKTLRVAVRCACVVGAQVWLGLRDGGLEVREAASGEAAGSVPAADEGRAWCLCAVGAAGVWVGTDTGVILVYHARTLQSTEALRQHCGGVYTLLYTHRTGARAVWSAANDFTVCRWEVSGALLQVYAGHSNGVRAVLPIGPKLWSGSSDATVRVWDVGEAQCEHVLQGHTAAVLALAANGPAVLSSSEDHTVRSWSVVTYQCLQTVDMGYRVQGLVRVGGHDVWACGYHPNLQVWDARTLNLLHEVEGHASWVNSIVKVKRVETRDVWSTSLGDGTVRLWRQRVAADDDAAEELAVALTANAAHERQHELDGARIRELEQLLQEERGRVEVERARADALVEREALLENEIAVAMAMREAALKERESGTASAAEEQAALAASLATVREELRVARAQVAAQAEVEELKDAALAEQGRHIEAMEAAIKTLRDQKAASDVEGAALRKRVAQLEAEAGVAAQALAAAQEEHLRLTRENTALQARCEETLITAQRLKGELQETQHLLEAERLKVEDAEAALQLKAHQYDDATSRAAAQSREIRLMIADAERLREALDAATTRAAAAADAEARGASALEQETARARQSDALCAEQQRAIAALEAEVTTLKTESAALQDRLQQERRERRDAAARGGAAQDALQQLQAETDALRREAAAGAQKLAAAQQSAQQLTARVAQLTADVGHGRDREAALQQRLADLDIFKLDVIARELKKVELLLSNSKTTVQSYIASDAKRITHFGERDAVVLFLREVLDVLHNVRLTVKDIIKTCFSSIQKMHIGAAVHGTEALMEQQPHVEDGDGLTGDGAS